MKKPCRAVLTHTGTLQLAASLIGEGWGFHSSVWRPWSARCCTAPRRDLPAFLLPFLVISVFNCADGSPREQPQPEGVPACIQKFPAALS